MPTRRGRAGRQRRRWTIDPTTLGTVAAGLVAKGVQETADPASDPAWGLLHRVGNRVRIWFGDTDDAPGLQALMQLELAPESARNAAALAGRIARAALVDPDGATDLALLFDAIRWHARPAVAGFVADVLDQARSSTRPGARRAARSGLGPQRAPAVLHLVPAIRDAGAPADPDPPPRQ